jgi:hypothetical protein
MTKILKNSSEKYSIKLIPEFIINTQFIQPNSD